MAKYNYDKNTGTITLSAELKQEFAVMVESGDMVEAIKKLMSLTGAGLKVAKDYLDNL